MRETWPGFILHVVLFSIYISALHAAGVGCRITTCPDGPRPWWHLDAHGGLASQQQDSMPQMPPIFISHHHVRTLPAHCSPPGPPRLPCEGGVHPSHPLSVVGAVITLNSTVLVSRLFCRLPARLADRPTARERQAEGVRASGRQGAPGCQLTMLDAVIG